MAKNPFKSKPNPAVAQSIANTERDAAAIKARADKEALRAQRQAMRALRSRGLGFFETDYVGGSSPLGGDGGLS